MSKDTVFKIKKSYLPGLTSWLLNQRLDGKRSRERTRFVKMLNTEIKTLEQERLEIIGKYVVKEKAKKGEKEKWKTTTVDNRNEYVIEDGKREQFDEEIKALYDEDYILTVTAEHATKMACIKDIVLNTDYKFGADDSVHPALREQKIREAMDYDAWCESFEQI